MAKQIGITKMEGFIDGKIYYKMKGEYYVRNSSAPSREKIMKAPGFQAMRDYAKEFGAVSTISSHLKKSFDSFAESISDKTIMKRISILFKQIIKKGPGERGSRTVEIVPNKTLFTNFSFNKKNDFDQVYPHRYKIIISQNRKEGNLEIFTNPKEKFTSLTKGTTHYRLIFSLLTFSDYVADVQTGKYIPKEPLLNRHKATIYSDLIPAKNNTNLISLKVTLPVTIPLPETLGVIACIGIEFYQEANGQYYSLESNNCMKIALVG